MVALCAEGRDCVCDRKLQHFVRPHEADCALVAVFVLRRVGDVFVAHRFSFPVKTIIETLEISVEFASAGVFAGDSFFVRNCLGAQDIAVGEVLLVGGGPFGWSFFRFHKSYYTNFRFQPPHNSVDVISLVVSANFARSRRYSGDVVEVTRVRVSALGADHARDVVEVLKNVCCVVVHEIILLSLVLGLGEESPQTEHDPQTLFNSQVTTRRLR